MHNFVISGKFLGQVVSVHKLKESMMIELVWYELFSMRCHAVWQGTSVGKEREHYIERKKNKTWSNFKCRQNFLKSKSVGKELRNTLRLIRLSPSRGCAVEYYLNYVSWSYEILWQYILNITWNRNMIFSPNNNKIININNKK